MWSPCIIICTHKIHSFLLRHFYNTICWCFCVIEAFQKDFHTLVSAQYLKKLPYSIRLFIRLFSKQSYRIFLIHHVLLVIVIIPRAILYAWHPIFTFIVYFIFCIILSALLSYISKPVALLLKTLLDY